VFPLTFSFHAPVHRSIRESQWDSNPSAQGCEARATLGYLPRNFSTLKGLHHLRSLLQLLQSCFHAARAPSVVASLQRWADRCNRVAVGSSRQFAAPSGAKSLKPPTPPHSPAPSGRVLAHGHRSTTPPPKAPEGWRTPPLFTVNHLNHAKNKNWIPFASFEVRHVVVACTFEIRN